MRIMRRAAGAALAAAVLALPACSGGPVMAEVQGLVTMNGKPLDKVQVEFWPEVDGPRSYAVTDEQGRYTLVTDDARRRGAVVGPHRIVLHDVGVLGDKLMGRKAEGVDLAKGKKIRVPAAYSNSASTPLKREVVNGPNTIDLEVK